MISITCNRQWMNKVIIFCAENDIKKNAIIKSLLVWWMGLPVEDRIRFIEKYSNPEKYPEEGARVGAGITFDTIEEKQEVDEAILKVQWEMKRKTLSFTSLITSLVNWFMELPPDDIEKFRKKYYLDGKKRGIKAIQNNVEMQGGKLDSDLVDQNQLEKAKVIIGKPEDPRKYFNQDE